MNNNTAREKEPLRFNMVYYLKEPLEETNGEKITAFFCVISETTVQFFYKVYGGNSYEWKVVFYKSIDKLVRDIAKTTIYKDQIKRRSRL